MLNGLPYLECLEIKLSRECERYLDDIVRLECKRYLDEARMEEEDFYATEQTDDGTLYVIANLN